MHNRLTLIRDWRPQRRYVAILAVLLCAAGRATGPDSRADEPLVVQLWPGQAPEEPGTIGEERKFPSKPNKDRSETTEVTQLITNVTKPTITIYRAVNNSSA